MSRKQTFPCGHVGKGRSCSRCPSASPPAPSPKAAPSPNSPSVAKAEPEPLESKADKEAWRETFESDPIPLTHLPSRGLVVRARLILSEINKGAPWHQFNGKRLNHDRNVVSVPLGRRYRIVFRTDDGPPKPIEVLSHEAYNATKPGRK